MVNGILDDLKLKYKTGNITTKIIYINVVIFFSLWLIDNFAGIAVSNWLRLPRIQENFALQPWSILTYTWMHFDVWQLLMNMILLYFIGQLFLQFFRDKDLLTFYIFGGIVGGLSFLIFPIKTTSLLAGSSAAIYTLLFAVISYNPRMPVRLVLFPSSFPILYFGYFFLGLDLLQIILKGTNMGGSISHLGGMAFGYLYMKQFEKGNDFLGNFIQNFKNIFSKKVKKSSFKTYKNYSKSNSNKVPKNDYDFNHQKVEKQNKINTILDKISRSGYESLSKEEKDFLFKEGR
ncbi:rhomboid family intramembrane serine protease [Faecalibacter bovis]|uniref:Rhomboid family intramembrane serine protease n=1 Tax=Faecalibacter bovis TaxID=2898187 RepID=A0ABX7XDU5_9FLAO|nr:rhomboid family intramembrane serine protease [Faecalibacter bovis]QTV06096.1 rhomboid family intramembrane serine protease [Faecalibacter bovis]